MSEEEKKKILEAEKAKAAKEEALRQTKLEDARQLIMSMKITSAPDMPKPMAPGNIMRGTVELQTNLFGIRMEEDRRIYKYDVDSHAEIGEGERKKIVEFSKKGRSDYMVTDRKLKCMKIFYKAVQKGSFYRDDLMFFYDGQSLMYTTEKLVFKSSKKYETIILDASELSDDLATFKFINFSVKECQENGDFECHLSDIRKIDRDIVKRDRSAMQFVDIVTSMYALSQSDTRFTIFANGKIFPNRPDLERIQTVNMKEGKVMIPGMNKSVKLVEGPRGRSNASPALAVDSLKVAFHVKEKLIDKAMGCFPDITSKYNNHDIESFATMVKGLGCTTNHTKKARMIEIHGVARENSTKKMEFNLNCNLNRTMTIAEYFEFKYDYKIKYPLAPLVMSKERGHINLYPMEVLDILPMQRVTIPQTTSIQSQVATKECAVPPGIRQNAILEQCNLHDLFNPEQKFMKAAGIGLVPIPLRVTGRLLKGPLLQYKTNEMEVVQPNWRPPQNYKFAVAATCEKWGLYCTMNNRDTWSLADMHKFAEAFVRRCRERGMTIGEPHEVKILDPPPADKGLDFPIREAVKDAAYKKMTFAFFLTNEFITVHKHLKLQERYSSVITQDLKLKTAQNYILKGQQLTLDNIIYKTNLKLGGQNYNLSLRNVVGNAINPFPAHRLILGIGVSHAPTVQFIHTAGEKPPAPAVVGFCANMASLPTEYIGDYLFQDARKEDLLLCSVEMLQRVIDRFIGAVDADGKRTGQPTKPLPKEMIVYRQGVSEGFYAMCLREEIPLMKAVLAKNGAKEVKVTYIIVQKEHCMRLMPVDINTTEKATVQNIGSGVVVDSQMTHPRYREFFLNSHVTLQGSARTPRYTILNDDSDLSMNAIECITHALCHNFQIVNSPVSIPAPLYIANRYAERGVALYTAKATDELATSEQKIRNSYEEMNQDLTYGKCKMGNTRLNA